MPYPTPATMLALSALEHLVMDFFRQSAGQWRSQRRYFTLKSGDVQEVLSQVKVEFLPQGCDQLVQLAQMHGLDDPNYMIGGARSTWESRYSVPHQKESTGSTVFGVRGSNLYRDRGFATPNPLIAEYSMPEPLIMRLHSEYSGSAFEEEIKLVGDQYRTRQTIISRAGKEQMIGQYLETRVES
jgi:CpeS-like protein